MPGRSQASSAAYAATPGTTTNKNQNSPASKGTRAIFDRQTSTYFAPPERRSSLLGRPQHRRGARLAPSSSLPSIEDGRDECELNTSKPLPPRPNTADGEVAEAVALESAPEQAGQAAGVTGSTVNPATRHSLSGSSSAPSLPSRSLPRSSSHFLPQHLALYPLSSARAKGSYDTHAATPQTHQDTHLPNHPTIALQEESSHVSATVTVTAATASSLVPPSSSLPVPVVSVTSDEFQDRQRLWEHGPAFKETTDNPNLSSRRSRRSSNSHHRRRSVDPAAFSRKLETESNSAPHQHQHQHQQESQSRWRRSHRSSRSLGSNQLLAIAHPGPTPSRLSADAPTTEPVEITTFIQREPNVERDATVAATKVAASAGHESKWERVKTTGSSTLAVPARAAGLRPASSAMPYDRNGDMSQAKGHSRTRSQTSKRGESSQKGKANKPSQKAMLSRALQKANTAVQLDNAQNFEGARLAYLEACDLLQQVLQRTSAEEDKRKLEAIVGPIPSGGRNATLGQV